jgi:hypothetical protein
MLALRTAAVADLPADLVPFVAWVWFLVVGEWETANLLGSTASLSRPEFRRVAEELNLESVPANRFVLDTP